MKLNETARVETTRTIHLDASDIVDLLRTAGYEVPNDADVVVCYRYEDIDVDEISPIVVSWKIVTTSAGE